MLKFKIIKLGKIATIFKQFTKVLGEHAFLTSLAFIFLSLTLGALVFYKYSILVSQKEPEVLEKPIYFNEEIFQEVIKILEDRQKRFKEADLKTYPDPFLID